MKTITLDINEEDFVGFCEHLSSWNHCPYELGLNGCLEGINCVNNTDTCKRCYAKAIETSIRERFANSETSVNKNERIESHMPIEVEEARQLCVFIEFNLLDYIRQDTEIDNMSWLVLMTDLFKRMADFCNYKGFTYSVGE